MLTDHLLWSSGNYYFYPAITLDGSGADNSLAVFGNWSSSERYVSGVFRMYTDQPNTTDGPFISFDSGESVFVNIDDYGRNRWGDYSGVGFDWVCGFAWGGVETAADISNQWRTIITARAFDDEDMSCLEGNSTSNSIVPAIYLLLGD
ncbi:MAG: hypothetical protein KZQ70_10630 [gamma proteobacterium symbiont of Lucinoma myriamae]|nr:hypothetical protein [gamma proteobacterium symbiont of Lucinoma myriamae]MCU7818343.1 hypothetical protein [gamma proteobacterium symbiont of Lucinoma myriamae]MCU7832918.1 hypothetical protein [gamma proteobacterium symbiont of Lucinoma myriamae]